MAGKPLPKAQLESQLYHYIGVYNRAHPGQPLDASYNRWKKVWEIRKETRWAFRYVYSGDLAGAVYWVKAWAGGEVVPHREH